MNSATGITIKKIMIIDDSATIANVMKRVLINAGYAVETVLDSATVFDGCLLEFIPDLFIIDINMPGFDGYYVLDTLKKNNICPKSKIMMCSTKFFEQDVNKARNLGADDFLAKPFTDKELIDKVSSLVG